MALHLYRREPLQDLDLFAGCSRREAARIRSLLTMLHTEAGTVLISQGTLGREFLVLADGEAEVSVRTSDGERVVATLGAGDFVGEMALLAHDPRSATVTAVTPLTFYVCNSAEFAGLLEAAPGVAARITAAAAARHATLAA